MTAIPVPHFFSTQCFLKVYLHAHNVPYYFAQYYVPFNKIILNIQLATSSRCKLIVNQAPPVVISAKFNGPATNQGACVRRLGNSVSYRLHVSPRLEILPARASLRLQSIRAMGHTIRKLLE